MAQWYAMVSSEMLNSYLATLGDGNMRKNVLCIYCLLIALLISGCGKKVQYNFMQDQSAINRIEIVEVGEVTEVGGYMVHTQKTLAVITDIAAFMEEFNKMDCYYLYSDPIGIEAETTAVKLIYDNGEYEVIAADGMAEYTEEYRYRNYVGNRYFDSEQFNDLLVSYLGEGHIQQEIEYYTLEDFQSIVEGESTLSDVEKIAPIEPLYTISSARLMCEYPMENGQYICIKFGEENIVSSIEVH